LTPPQTPINLKVSAGSEQNSSSISEQVKGMFLRVIAALVLCAVAFSSSASGQVVRFDTTAGDFDMVLNPTNDPRLQGHVDNMLRYVEENRYNSTWINRAAEGFVLQMGGLYSHTRRPPLTIASTRPLATFDPVRGAPAEDLGLSNTAGTVALALPSDSASNPLPNAGTSSFFINLTSNAFLDPSFTVFAAIPDMTVVNQIMALMQQDYTTKPLFGASGGGATFEDVPITADGKQVFIERAFVVTDTLSVARARSGVQSIMTQSAASLANGSISALLASDGAAQLASDAAFVVPEPAAALLAALGISGLALPARRARRARRA
jgi:cyclophilin family peptidyl-prolyl cis-trans isomerase